MGNTKLGKGTKVIDVVESKGTPVAVHIAAASLHDVQLIEPTLDNLPFEDRVPEHLLSDKAADSDPFRKHLLKDRGIELVCTHRHGRTRPDTQDARARRQLQRR